MLLQCWDDVNSTYRPGVYITCRQTLSRIASSVSVRMRLAKFRDALLITHGLQSIYASKRMQIEVATVLTWLPCGVKWTDTTSRLVAWIME